MTMVLEKVALYPFRGGPALFPPISLTVPPGQIATLMGPSGIGKSTLLDFIGGHRGRGFRASGRVLLYGVDLTDVPA